VPGKPEIGRLLAALDTPRWRRHRPLILTAILTGMRSSELRGLVWSAVDLNRRTITIRQRADAWGTMGMPKSEAGQREIPLASETVSMLREWKLACPPNALELVFPSAAGKVHALTNIGSRIWRPLQKAAGLVDAAGKPLFNFHALRHFAASSWIEAGFSPKRLQALLGHSSITMTFDTYGHLFPAAKDDQDKMAQVAAGLVVA
jgi:integrase